MKKLVCLVLVLALGSAASALSGTVLEDFESYPVGDILSNHGWYGGNLGAGIRIGADGTKSVWDSDVPSYYYQVWRGDATDTAGLFTNPLSGNAQWLADGKSHMAMTLVPQKFDTTYGIQRQDGYPGPIIGGGLDPEGDGTCQLMIQKALWNPEVHTTQQVPQGHVIDLVLNMTTEHVGETTVGSLFYRDITAEGVNAPWHATSIVDEDLMNPYWMPLYNRLYIRGAFYGEQDDLAFGLGHVEVPEPATIALLGLGGLLLRKRR